MLLKNFVAPHQRLGEACAILGFLTEFVCFETEVSRYPAAGKCLQKTRYPAVRNFDQFSRNSSFNSSKNKRFKVDRLQIIVVAKNITVLQLFISRMPKMCAIPQLVSAPLNPIPTVDHFRRSHPQCEHSYGQHIYMSEEIKAK